MQGQVAVDPGEQVLAARLTTSVTARPDRSAVASCGTRKSDPVSTRPGQRVVQAAPGQPDGVSLGHGVSIVSRRRGMMPAGADAE